MKNFNRTEVFKNTAGAVFLLAAAFFVSSTLLSMRAVLADPIAADSAGGFYNNAPQAPRAGSAQAVRTSPRGENNSATTARTNGGAAVVAPVAGRSTASRAAPVKPVASRAVVSRTNASGSARTTQNRGVISRAGTVSTNASRVSLTGSAIRGSNGTSNTSYQYLTNKLYTGNYSNIIDSTTGLISADAYSNCMESYYTCMDEICTARNSAQRRCACAGRVKAFATAETSLESSNEELIKVSGELALLVATKGKDISAAFQLTDAEKVMNCVSWQEARKDGTATDAEMVSWCNAHSIYQTTSCNLTTPPTYCKSNGNSFSFDIANLDGSSSDILASLKSWADAKENTLTITASDDDNLLGSFTNLVNVVGGLTGTLSETNVTKDSLAETWGYELFEYAHNNVCNRVLDSCFNGIYESCGTPTGTKKCATGSTCPFNYNSTITVSNSGTYELNFITGNSGTSNSTATCYGYTTSSGDPYSALRAPVADSRRSILQKYALDANADCDAYGEKLRVTAQNVGYQKTAAQQALQKKRLEFAQDETKKTLSDAVAAGSNFNECISELYDCYNTQATSNVSWSTSRIKTYCAQIANVPHCYEQMICNPSSAQFKAVIDVLDSASCMNSQDYTKNTCRNIVSLNEILTRASATATTIAGEMTGDSAGAREKCLQDSIGTGSDTLRNWTRPVIVP